MIESILLQNKSSERSMYRCVGTGLVLMLGLAFWGAFNLFARPSADRPGRADSNVEVREEQENSKHNTDCNARCVSVRLAWVLPIANKVNITGKVK